MTPHSFAYTAFEAPPHADRSGRFWALTVYVLYALAFVTAITAPIGAFIAYRNRHRHGLAMRGTFDLQIRIFWVGILASIAIGVAHAAVVGLSAITFGVGGILMVVPWAMIAVWWLWTGWAIFRGLMAIT